MIYAALVPRTDRDGETGSPLRRHRSADALVSPVAPVSAHEGPWVAAYRIVNPATGQPPLVTLPEVVLVSRPADQAA